MGTLSANCRVQFLLWDRSRCDQRIKALHFELRDLKTYGQNIADGGISIGEMFNVPTTMFPRQLMYMHSAAQYSQLSATTQMNQLMQTPYYQSMMSQQDAQVQQAYQQMMYQSFYKNSQQQFAKYEAKLLQEKETAMQQELDSLKIEREAIESELQGARQQASEGLKEFFNRNS